MTVSQRNKIVAKETSEVVMQDMAAEKLAGVINSVYANGSGLRVGDNDYLEINLNLPDNVLGENYTLFLDGENRMIIAENSEAGLQGLIGTASIIPSNVNSFELKPENLSDEIRIFWENDSIKVESC